MNDYSKIPWNRIREYLLLLSSSRTLQDFLHIAGAEIQSIVPFDAAAGVFWNGDATYLSGLGISDSVNASYNSYYRIRQPAFQSGKRTVEYYTSMKIFDWRNYHDLEFATDFMLANGMYKSLTNPGPDHLITVAVQRSRMSPDFTERDVHALGLINEYLNSLYSTFDTRSASPVPNLSGREIAERFHSLSLREVDVCSLIARRLTTAEIATCLFISPRTVEKHIEGIFFKLDVHSREQLRWRLGATPPATPAAAGWNGERR
jgi:DNA-binding CsgD family transcriptional regulator